MSNRTMAKFICLWVPAGCIVGFGIAFFVSRFTPTDSDDPGFKSEYVYGQDLYVKDGFYKDYSCIVIREYKKSVLCKISRIRKEEKLDDGTISVDYKEIKEAYMRNINFRKTELSTDFAKPVLPPETEHSADLCKRVCDNVDQGNADVLQYSMGMCLCNSPEGMKAAEGYHLLINNQCRTRR
jgi:hypothetical protein